MSDLVWKKRTIVITQDGLFSWHWKVLDSKDVLVEQGYTLTQWWALHCAKRRRRGVLVSDA